MNHNTSAEPRFLNQSLWQNIIAFLCIIVLILLRHTIIQHKINQQIYSTNIINVAGKQRMLSQKIAKDFFALTGDITQQMQVHYINDIATSIESWEQENINLKTGVIAHNFVFENSTETMALYKQIEESHQTMLDVAKETIARHRTQTLDKHSLTAFVDVVRNHEEIYLAGIDRIVSQYDLEAVEKMRSIRSIENILFVVLIGSVVIQLLFIFLPRQRMLKQAFADIQYLSCHDKLTGIYNRYRFDQDITTEMERSDRYDFSLAMIIYDLDRFKQVNDTYGHQIGDEVLTRSAEIAKKCIHHGDVLARFGGEEFVILAPYTNLAGAILIAESIRKAMEQENFPTANTVTASFGVAEKFHGESYTAWFKRVDLALYQAKAMGRNRVCSDHDIKELV